MSFQKPVASRTTPSAIVCSAPSSQLVDRLGLEVRVARVRVVELAERRGPERRAGRRRGASSREGRARRRSRAGRRRCRRSCASSQRTPAVATRRSPASAIRSSAKSANVRDVAPSSATPKLLSLKTSVRSQSTPAARRCAPHVPAAATRPPPAARPSGRREERTGRGPAYDGVSRAYRKEASSERSAAPAPRTPEPRASSSSSDVER